MGQNPTTHGHPLTRVCVKVLVLELCSHEEVSKDRKKHFAVFYETSWESGPHNTYTHTHSCAQTLTI